MLDQIVTAQLNSGMLALEPNVNSTAFRVGLFLDEPLRVLWLQS